MCGSVFRESKQGQLPTEDAENHQAVAEGACETLWNIGSPQNKLIVRQNIWRPQERAESRQRNSGSEGI